MEKFFIRKLDRIGNLADTQAQDSGYDMSNPALQEILAGAVIDAVDVLLDRPDEEVADRAIRLFKRRLRGAHIAA